MLALTLNSPIIVPEVPLDSLVEDSTIDIVNIAQEVFPVLKVHRPSDEPYMPSFKEEYNPKTIFKPSYNNILGLCHLAQSATKSPFELSQLSVFEKSAKTSQETYNGFTYSMGYFTLCGVLGGFASLIPVCCLPPCLQPCVAPSLSAISSIASARLGIVYTGLKPDTSQIWLNKVETQQQFVTELMTCLGMEILLHSYSSNRKEIHFIEITSKRISKGVLADETIQRISRTAKLTIAELNRCFDPLRQSVNFVIKGIVPSNGILKNWLGLLDFRKETFGRLEELEERDARRELEVKALRSMIEKKELKE